jgi:hypothetical protein
MADESVVADLEKSNELSWVTYTDFHLWLGARVILVGIGLLVPIVFVWQRLGMSPFFSAILLFAVFLGLPTFAAAVYLNSVTSIGYGNGFVILRSKVREEILRSSIVAKLDISNAIVGCYLGVQGVDGKHRRIWLPRQLVDDDFLRRIEMSLRLSASRNT